MVSEELTIADDLVVPIVDALVLKTPARAMSESTGGRRRLQMGNMSAVT